MDYSRLYSLSEDFGFKRAFRASTEQGVFREPFAVLGNEEKPTRAIRFDFHYSGGEIVHDLIWTGWLLPLVSTRVLSTLRQMNITGWTTYSVELYDKRGKPIPGYHGLAITGRCGAIDRSRSRKVRHPIMPGTSPADFWQGLFFKDDRWDGSDIFLPEGTGHKFVTQRVKNALESLKIPNIMFERLDVHETHI